MLRKEVKSPCKFIYTMNNILLNAVEVSDKFTTVEVAVPAKNIAFDVLAERYARSVYGYYRSIRYNKVAKKMLGYNKESNSYTAYSTDIKVSKPATEITYKDGFFIVTLITMNTVDESMLEI